MSKWLGSIADHADDAATFLLASWERAMMRMKVGRSPLPLEQFKRVIFTTLLVRLVRL
ncbi:TetR family transcriptional regulator C-terminal domain-containing protein [Burkholderia sp. AU19243]|nr:TetR family transcriptional regulator C-terminal domain-containing protein [Burkholderia vietnamiensis]MBR8366510.1 TetR family transcriptional regulator C-terminal domain-containing protein [Burkholderia sp. AU19243]